VGVNIDYLDDFEHAQHGDNVFSIQQVKDATDLCVKIRKDLLAVHQDVVDNAEPYEQEPDNAVWPDAPNCSARARP
jgi:hypothetical protein